MNLRLVAAIVFLFNCFVFGQGPFQYDQQAINLIEGAAGLQSAQPLGQSFTPSLSSIGFVELNLYDGDTLHTAGATVFVNVRSNSVTGPILGSSAMVFMPDGFFGVTNFIFSTPIGLAPGQTYYLQPLVQSGDGWGSYVTDGSYAGGTEIYQGVPVPGRNLWFREGVVVPEPSSVLLLVLGFGALMARLIRLPKSPSHVLHRF